MKDASDQMFFEYLVDYSKATYLSDVLSVEF